MNGLFKPACVILSTARKDINFQAHMWHTKEQRELAIKYFMHLADSQGGTVRQQAEEGDEVNHLQEQRKTEEARAQVLPAQ